MTAKISNREKALSADNDLVIQLLESQRSALESANNKVTTISLGWLATIAFVVGFQMYSFATVKKEIQEELIKAKSDLYADMAASLSGSVNETGFQELEQRLFFSFIMAIKSNDKKLVARCSDKLSDYLEYQLSQSSPPKKDAENIFYEVSSLPDNLKSISTEKLKSIASKINAKK